MNAGLSWSGGIVARARRGVRVTEAEEADAVRRLRRSGAIVTAHTNIPELAMWSECANRVFGRTLNPYDTRRTSGGSSGGEGALVGFSSHFSLFLYQRSESLLTISLSLLAHGTTV